MSTWHLSQILSVVPVWRFAVVLLADSTNLGWSLCGMNFKVHGVPVTTVQQTTRYCCTTILGSGNNAVCHTTHCGTVLCCKPTWLVPEHLQRIVCTVPSHRLLLFSALVNAIGCHINGRVWPVVQ